MRGRVLLEKEQRKTAKHLHSRKKPDNRLHVQDSKVKQKAMHAYTNVAFPFQANASMMRWADVGQDIQSMLATIERLDLGPHQTTVIKKPMKNGQPSILAIVETGRQRSWSLYEMDRIGQGTRGNYRPVPINEISYRNFVKRQTAWAAWPPNHIDRIRQVVEQNNVAELQRILRIAQGGTQTQGINS